MTSSIRSDALTEPATKPRILVVEDEAMIRMDLTYSLQQMGYDVVEAFSIADAKRHLDGGEGALISAIVTDIGLPDGRGDEFAGTLRAERPGDRGDRLQRPAHARKIPRRPKSRGGVQALRAGTDRGDAPQTRSARAYR